MATISTPRYLLDQTRRRLTPTLDNIPGVGAIEQRLLDYDFKPKVPAEPPVGSDLKPVLGNSGVPVFGHIRFPVPPFKWWRGLRARKLLEEYFYARVRERRDAGGSDMLTDEDIVNRLTFLLMSAHDTSTTTITNVVYQLAANPEWQERCRDESARLGDAVPDIESLEKLEALELVMNESLRLVGPLPFGGGAHKCVGMVFGQLEVKTVVHRLLRRYRLELVRPNYRSGWDYGGMPILTDRMPIVLRPLRGV